MRKIETQMNKALRTFSNWSSGNTTVTSTPNEMKVHLHGNHIATLDKITMDLFIFDGGWQSNTTKSRLNAILHEFTYGDCSVIQRNFTWFLNDRLFNKPVPFFSGMAIN